MIRISIAEQGGAPRLVTFDKAEVILGRAPTCDLPLTGKGVSGRHCRFVRTPQGVFIEDLGSTNGTYVNRQRLTASRWVTDADEIVLAVYLVRLLEGAPAQGTASPPSPAAHPVQPASAPWPAATDPGVAMPGYGPAPTAPHVAAGVPGSLSAPAPGSRPNAAPSVSGATPPNARPSGMPGPTHARPSPSMTPGPSPTPGPAPTQGRPQPGAPSVAPTSDRPPSSPPGATPAPDDVVWAREWNKIDSLSRAWISSARDPGALLTGAKLKHARRWLAQGRGKQPAPRREHREFIGASVRRAQLRMFRNVTVVGVSLGVVVAVGFKIARQPAEDEPNADTVVEDVAPGEQPKPKQTEDFVAASDEAAGRAEELLESDPRLAAALALEGLRRLPGARGEHRGSRAERAFRKAMANLRGRPLIAADGPVEAVAISPNGRYVVTGGGRVGTGLARVWDLTKASQVQPFALRGHAYPVTRLALSPDGRYLFTAAADPFIQRWDLSNSEPLTTELKLGSGSTGINDIAISGDGRWLVSGSSAGQVRLWDATADTAKGVDLRAHDAPVRTVAISHDGSLVATGSEDSVAAITRVEGGVPGRRVQLAGHTAGITDIAISPDKTLVLTGSADQTARLWDASRSFPGLDSPVLGGHEGPVTHVAITADGELGITGGSDGKLRLWELRSDEPSLNRQAFSLHRGAITGVQAAGPRQRLGQRPPSALESLAMSSSEDGAVRSWNLDRKDREQDSIELVGHAGPVRAVASTPDGLWTVSGGQDGWGWVWDPRSSVPEGPAFVARGHARQVLSMAVSGAGHRLLTGSEDGTARLWDLGHHGLLQTLAVFEGHKGRLRQVAMSPVDGRFAATAGDDGIVRLWDLSHEKPAANHLPLSAHKAEVTALEFSQDGALLVSASADQHVALWNMRTDKVAESVRLIKHDSEVNAIAISPDGRRLMTAAIATLRLIDISSDPPKTFVLKGHEVDLITVGMDHTGRWAVSSSRDPALILWDLKGPEPVPTRLRRHTEIVEAVAFDVRGRWLFSGSRDSSIRLWNLASEHPSENSLELKGHKSGVARLAESPDGRWLASAGYDNTIFLWDLDAGDGAAIEASAIALIGHTNLISSLEFTSDGRYLLTTSYDGTARLWPLDPHDLVEVGCLRIGAGLDRENWERYFPRRPYQDACR